MTETAQNILKTLGYFDLFRYPLTAVEIRLFNQCDIDAATINIGLEELLLEGCVFRLDEFYALHNDEQLVSRRRKGNDLAAMQMKTARQVAKFLAGFPYVKAIAVSGSLSKNFATHKTDIDFFVITAANRLWIARTCMHLYKKLTFIRGRQNWFCMNYYVDEAAMEIEEKNIFTAVEIVTLLPMHGKESLHDFMEKNRWTNSFFPLKVFNNNSAADCSKGLFSKLLEKFFSGKLGDFADKKLMQVTEKRWRRKEDRKALNSRGGLMGMCIGRHFSKPDPKNFQDKVVKAYRENMEAMIQHKKITASFVL